MNVYQKLQTARIKLQNTKLAKSGHNKFAGYQYFELGDFLPAIQTIFSDIGLCGAISFGPEIAMLEITNIDKPEEKIHLTSPMAEAALKGCHPIQNLGAAQTYLRRYLWVTAMEIVEHDALDATTAKDMPRQAPVAVDTFKALPRDSQDYLRDCGMEAISLLSKGNAEDAYDYIESLELDADHKVGLWSLLDSKQRSTLKKIKESRTATH
ncbi:MAG: hypothetical protein NVS3B3_18700 [Aquirhabdus sp.]